MEDFADRHLPHVWGQQTVLKFSDAFRNPTLVLENPRDGMEEVLPVEVVSLILVDHVDPLCWPCCRFVCRRWYSLLAHAKSAVKSDLARADDPEAGETAYAAMLAARGWLSVLKWAASNGCPCGKEFGISAAFAGRLDVLEWVRSEGYEMDELTCAYAAKGCQLEVLKSRVPVLMKIGCPE